MQTKYMVGKKIDNRRLNRSRSIRSVRRFALVFFLGFALVVGMIFSGWVRWKQREISYRMNRAEATITRLTEEQRKLQLSFASLKNPQRISEIATNDLGMVYATTDDVVFVDVPPDQETSPADDPVPGGGDEVR